MYGCFYFLQLWRVSGRQESRYSRIVDEVYFDPTFAGLPDVIRDRLHQSLLEAPDFVEASIYDSAKYQAVDRLEKAWIRFLKEDLKAFLE